MALNIKNDEAHRLAQELAQATGVSLTDAVTEALRERIAALRRHASEHDLIVLEVREVQAFVAALPDRDVRTDEEILDYDRFGLPR